jgi:hypothetical protein
VNDAPEDLLTDALWLVGAFLLLGAVESDRCWVNQTTERDLPQWWTVVPALVPALVLLSLVEHYRARQTATSAEP